MEVLLDVAGLPRSTYFYHQARLLAPDPQADLKAAVTEIFKKSHARYGHRRVHIELVQNGWTVAKKDGPEADAFAAAGLQGSSEEALQLLSRRAGRCCPEPVEAQV
nr:IS3 family transposase [Arthrobacter sp. H16F315]